MKNKPIVGKSQLSFSFLLNIIFVILSLQAHSQFSLDAEFRPRVEYRDGYRTLSEDGEKGVLLVTQRTRLNATYLDKNRIKSYLSFQDIRTWGSYNLDTNDPTITLYQAWVKYPVTDRLNLKIGRQELEYDDLKILSNSNWRLQARSHDAALIEWMNRDSTLTVHLAGGVNNDRQVLFRDLYTTESYYKNMGMIWLNKKLTSSEVSLLFLDLGQQLADTSINHFKTVGFYGTHTLGNIKFIGSYYLQRGKNESDQKISSSMASMSAMVPISEKLSVTPGFDLLSGTEASDLLNSGYNETNSFIPLYARRHRYFGIQDMFYAGGFNVTAGLSDVFLKLSYKMTAKWSTRLHLHTFSTTERLVNASDNSIVNGKHLGYESDFFVDYKPNKDLSIGFAYTHFLPTENMEILKQRGDHNEIAHFTYIQIYYKPQFL